MSSAIHDGTLAVHPLVALADALEAMLGETANANAWSMTPTELAAVLPRLTRARQRIIEVELRVLAQADRASIGDEQGATNTPVWWARATGQHPATAHRAAKLAQALDDDNHAGTRAALAGGRVTAEQVHVILAAIEELPDDLPTGLASDAEAHLVGLADLDGPMRLDPPALRIAGRKVLEVLAPDIAEDHEAKKLADDERRAGATASLTMRPDGHGSMIGRFKIPVLHGQILAKRLNALAAPKHQRALVAGPDCATDRGPGSSAGAGRVARPLRWGQAFMEYLETRHASRMPKAGGVPATVVVTMDLASLLGSDKAATLDTGHRISAAEARRLACEAGIIPAVLGTPSQPLDLGRKTRFHTETQRIALMLRDGGCAVHGCDWPPSMCHAHHPDPWSKGGATSVHNGMLLCPRHHTLAHDVRHQLTTDKHGKVLIGRRT